MKSYKTVKNISKTLIYFSAALVLLSLVGAFFYQSRSTADTSHHISLNFSPDKVYQGETINILPSVEKRVENANHLSLFIARDGYTFSNLDKSTICEEANKPLNKDKYYCTLCLHKVFSCKDGECDLTYNWKTEEAGKHQIIAVLMSSSSSTVCAAQNVLDLYIHPKMAVVTAKDEFESTDESDGAGGDLDSTTSVAYSQKPASSAKLDLENPTSIKSIKDIINKVGYIFSYVVGILAFFALIVGGFQLITSAGNPDLQSKAKKTIMYAILGIVLAVFSYALVVVLVDTINKIF